MFQLPVFSLSACTGSQKLLVVGFAFPSQPRLKVMLIFEQLPVVASLLFNKASYLFFWGQDKNR